MTAWRRLNVLIGGERFGVIRDAFLRLGHNAVSCDLVPAEVPGPHYQGRWEDVEGLPEIDLAIYHRTCTYMANSGALRIYRGGKKENGLDESRWLELGRDAWAFWNHMRTCPVRFAAWENPIMVGYAGIMVGKPTQAVQPWQFGTDPDGPDNTSKATCWWLRRLPKLRPTGTLDGSTARQDVMALGPTDDPDERRMARAKSFPGMSAAIADQWSRAVIEATA